MKTLINKWGNSLAVHIPKSFATEINLVEGSEVELSLVLGKLIVSPVSESEYTLESLISGITEENRHHEIEM